MPRHPTYRYFVNGLGLTATLMLATSAYAQFVEPNATTLRLFEGDQNQDYYGWVSANIPDIDGDGVQELIIPAIGYNGFAGRATVYSGATGQVLNDVLGGPGELYGFGVGAAGDVNADGTPDYIIGGGRVEVYSGADHGLLWNLTPTTGFGHAVGTAGDVDGDGHDDLIVGSERTTVSGFTNAGRVYVLSGATGAVLWTREGTQANEFFGGGVGALGDVNADGTPDVVVGVWGAGPNGGGEAYILSGADGATLHTLQPEDPTTARVFGRFFASGAGDVDGDGVGDAFIGDYADAAKNTVGTGRAYVFSGRTGARLHLFTGFDPGDGLGPGRGIPDVNRDGHNDIIVAAYTHSRGGPFAGSTYVFSGRSGALLRTITATLANDNFGVDAISAGDVNGDGKDDFLVTAVGLSFAGTDHGRAYLIAGTDLPCPADLNDNGRVGLLDLIQILVALDAGDAEPDLNGDGALDEADVKVLIKDWGRCPGA